MVKINNVGSYVNDYRYVVYRDCGEDGNWFYGAWNDLVKASEVAAEIDGKVVETENVEPIL